MNLPGTETRDALPGFSLLAQVDAMLAAAAASSKARLSGPSILDKEVSPASTTPDAVTTPPSPAAVPPGPAADPVTHARAPDRLAVIQAKARAKGVATQAAA